MFHNPLNQEFQSGAKLYGKYYVNGVYLQDFVLLHVLYGCVGEGPNTTISFHCDPRAALPCWLKRAACGFP